MCYWFLSLQLRFPTANFLSALQNYVAGGGKLISEARLAWTNEKGFANEKVPGAGLDKVFGLYESNVLPVSSNSGGGSGPNLELHDEDYKHSSLYKAAGLAGPWFQFNANNTFGLSGLQVQRIATLWVRFNLAH